MNTRQFEYAVGTIESLRDDSGESERFLTTMNEIKDILIEEAFMGGKDLDEKKVIGFLQTINDISIIVKYLSMTTR